jgi:hypothetical protein
LPKPWAIQPPPGTGITVVEPPEGVNDHIPATEVTVSPAATGGAGQLASPPPSRTEPSGVELSGTEPSLASPEDRLPDDEPPPANVAALPEVLPVEPAPLDELLIWSPALEAPC